MAPPPGAGRETGIGSVGASSGSGDVPAAPPPVLGPRSFSAATICSQDFRLRPAADHGRDRFSWLSHPAICNYTMMGTLTLTLATRSKPSAALGGPAERLGVGFAPRPLRAVAPPSGMCRASHHGESHTNSKTTDESVLGRKCLTTLGGCLVEKHQAVSYPS